MLKIYQILASALLVALLLSACGSKQGNTKVGEVLARYGDAELSAFELAQIIPSNLSKNDSSALAQKLIDEWLKKQILLEAAQQSEGVNREEIARKVADYEATLYVEALRQKEWQNYNEQKPSAAEVKRFYKAHPERFRLSEPLAKALFVKIAKKQEKSQDIRRMMQAAKPDRQALRELCIKFAEVYHLADSSWLSLAEIWRSQAPPQLKVETLPRQNAFWEQSDANFFYFLKIEELKITAELAPLEFVEPQVTEWLLRQKRQEALEQWESKLYQKAQKEENVKFYNLK